MLEKRKAPLGLGRRFSQTHKRFLPVQTLTKEPLWAERKSTKPDLSIPKRADVLAIRTLGIQLSETPADGFVS